MSHVPDHDGKLFLANLLVIRVARAKLEAECHRFVRLGMNRHGGNHRGGSKQADSKCQRQQPFCCTSDEGCHESFHLCSPRITSDIWPVDEAIPISLSFVAL
jgi:hypothetical protein